MPNSVIAISTLGFAWPDGTPVFDGLDTVLGPGHVGLVGANGAGKSTLLRIIVGDLRPAAGSVIVPGTVGYLRQDLGLAAGQQVDAVLGIGELRAALQRIETGLGTGADFEMAAGRWDISERAIALLGRLGLDYLAGEPAQLDRRLDTLSGGETVLLGVIAQLLREPDLLLLDEPTNNLDQVARQRLYEVIEHFGGTVIAVSHDRELLERMNVTAELRAGTMRLFGGNFSAYERVLAAEQDTARAAVRGARSDVRKQASELVDARVKLDRRARYGQKMSEQKREPKIVMGARKRQAQVSAGKLRNSHIDKLDAAKEQLTRAQDLLRDDREIRVDLPGTAVHPGQEVLTLDVGGRRPVGSALRLQVTGPERIALTGRNGAGKTTLLQQIAAAGPRVPWRMLPQRLDIFDDGETVFENVAAAAPHTSAEQIRAQLARFLFRGARADIVAGAMSGGERLRAALAMLLLADPAPRLLLLDEPTNNLDLPSLSHVVQALAGYQGALIVVSHDQRFLHEIGITRWLALSADGLAEFPAAPGAEAADP